MPVQTRSLSYTARAHDQQRSTTDGETIQPHIKKDGKIGNNENTIESLLSKTHQDRATSTVQSSEANEQPAAPLDGIRVLDLTRVLGKKDLMVVFCLSPES